MNMHIFMNTFGNRSIALCYFGQITLFIRSQYSIGLELGYSNSMIYKKFAVGELASPRVIQPAT